MRVDTSGNVGIGTSSPGGYGKLVSLGGDNATTFAAVGATNMLRVQGYNSTYVGTLIEAVNLAQSANTPMFVNASEIKFGISGTEQARITAAGLFQFNSGYGSVATAYGCRAWVNFNGTGANGTNQTIRGSGNVSSVSKTSSGVYVMNFATAMPDTNYAALGTAIAGSAPAAPLNDTIGAYSFNTGNLGFQCTDGTSNTFTNPVFASIAIIR